MTKFDIFFSEVISFTPEGYYLSKNLFTQDEALHEFKKFFDNEDLQIKHIKQAYVRFQPTPQDLIDEGLSKMAWITCQPNDRNAQPCWFTEGI
ncbi:MAG: hypothetical protein U9N61_09850 [Euryarchaeota archaeon]|nr:hypothetical protein [Euryarchaeota archaeon]